MTLTFPTHALEAIAMCFGVANTYLAARANIWSWLFGMITVSLFFILFLQAGLYADMSSQIIFFVLQFYGLYQWLYGGQNHTALAISHTPPIMYLYALLACLILFICSAYLLATYSDSSIIYLDAGTTSISLIAQWMMSRKWVENWLLWIVMDIISIKMYLDKHLFLTSGLFFLLLILSINGYLSWKKSLAEKC